ncbi:MAG: hypothetical protein Q4E64_07865 [Phascolarctobacterium sp.]|uniref:hypothetical protein n=1 Tax=Phascolarctobacterium sp. TaxID=2049039 RepID=UPI0026DD5B38|nr:hypothetical protein [Phascolarctobacterium sp.]MDO4921726.1 hypothetical protein [Phascolarctobacterium sp.]
MERSGRSLFRRIRSVRSSLDNAEQSFLDNKDIRGELDLMLAEAELKNLRRKKDVPWSWNRHLLAACAAGLLVLAGFGGWYCAKDHYLQRRAAAAPAGAHVSTPVTAPVRQAVPVKTAVAKQTVQQDITAAGEEPEKQQVTISKADMRKLVQSARVELSNSK